ncbi:MAG: LytTR family DNA-binding domain-containing protein [Bacteroidota bacterium]
MKDQIKSVLVDDEQLSLDTLKWQLSEFCPEVVITGAFDNPNEAEVFLNENEIDICFLDIDMPEMNGFELLKQVKNRSFDVIFVTAYSEYAIKAFKVSAFDYLLKPIDEDDLVTCMKNYSMKAKDNIAQRIDLLFHQIQNKSDVPEKVAFHTSEGIHIVKQNQIIHLEAHRNYTTIYREKDSSIIVSKTLKEVEKLLSNDQFFRIHQSHTINLSKVDMYHRGRGGSVTMNNSETLPVSKDKKEEFLNKLENIVRF